jgi:hypothetical protein
MQSDGGLASVDHFSGHKAVLSGPAGGYVGYALTTQVGLAGGAAVGLWAVAGLGWPWLLVLICSLHRCLLLCLSQCAVLQGSG